MTPPTLDDRLLESPYQDYLYAYPHKMSYRPLDPTPTLSSLWADEDTRSLFLYVHVPFCAIRCGFCNLFTTGNPGANLVNGWFGALARQVDAVRAALPSAGFARVAVGGGTPTHLTASELDRLFDLLESLGADPTAGPAGIETAPDTTTRDRLAVLRKRGVDRISMGVQSFEAAENKAALRPQRPRHVRAALDAIRAEGFPTLNLDLIYGLPGQTLGSWSATVDAALAEHPEELFLYPLYVRPKTGLGVQLRRRGAQARPPGRSLRAMDPDDLRPAMYAAARDRLRASGYEQRSLRFFRRLDAPRPPSGDYACQRDGMVGLGVGARSYTRAVHYASQYAVGARGVRELIEGYAAQSDFTRADWGIRLDGEEQRRRFAILGLLHVDGLDGDAWRTRFGSDLDDDLPALQLLVDRGLAHRDGAVLRLTDAGVLRSDTIGPWLISDAVRARMLAAEVA